MTAHSYVLTLIANPAKRSLSDTLVAKAASLMPSPAETRWLDEGIAADVVFAPSAPIDNKALQKSVAEALAAPVDVVVQRADQRRKMLFLADMDSTMIGQECIDELADKVGVKARVSEITERAMRGEIAFEPALRERVGLLKGLSAAVVDDVIKERITLTPGGRTLVQTMRANGAYTALVSGGFTLFTAKIAETLGFHENRANILLVADNAFTGMVADPILGKQAKLDSLLELRQKHGLAPWQTMAVGDGANDLAMINEAGLGVAYHAKPAVAAEAAASVIHGDLTALLYMQGYARKDFVEG